MSISMLRVDDTLRSRVGARGWLLAVAGAVLSIISTLLPWTYTSRFPGDLTLYFYPAGPQVWVLVLSLVALVVLLADRGPLAGLLRPVAAGRYGVARAAGTFALAIAAFTVAAIVARLGGLVNVDPGGWVAVVGTALLFTGARALPADTAPSHRKRLPDAAEFVVIGLTLGLVLLIAVIGLRTEDAELFIAYLVFVAGMALVAQRSGLLDWLTRMTGRHYGVTVAAAFFMAVLFPFTQAGSNRYLLIAAQIGLFATVAIGLNIVVGLAGLLDLGYVAFLGVGAYVGALLSGSAFSSISGVKPPFLVTMLLGALMAAIFGLIIGAPTLRLRGDYLAIVTLGFGEIFRISMNNLDGSAGPDVTNGPNGIPAIAPLNFFGFDFGATHEIFGVRLPSFANYYFLEILLMAFVVLVFVRMNNSRIGRAWVAIREDETAAQAMGINTTRLKLLAFAGGATLAGIAGTIKSHVDVSVTPDQYQFLNSAFLLAAIVLGGMGTIPGPLVGSTLLLLLPEKLRFFQDKRLLLFGFALIVMMRFRPEGLIANKRRQREFHEEDEHLAAEAEGGREVQVGA